MKGTIGLISILALLISAAVFTENLLHFTLDTVSGSVVLVSGVVTWVLFKTD